MSSSFVKDCADTSTSSGSNTVIIILNNEGGSASLGGQELQNLLETHVSNQSQVSVLQMDRGSQIAPTFDPQLFPVGSLGNSAVASTPTQSQSDVPVNFMMDGFSAIEADGYAELPLDPESIKNLESVLEGGEIFKEPLVNMVDNSTGGNLHDTVDASTDDQSSDKSLNSSQNKRARSPIRRSQRQMDKAEREEAEKIRAENRRIFLEERELLREKEKTVDNETETVDNAATVKNVTSPDKEDKKVPATAVDTESNKDDSLESTSPKGKGPRGVKLKKATPENSKIFKDIKMKPLTVNLEKINVNDVSNNEHKDNNGGTSMESDNIKEESVKNEDVVKDHIGHNKTATSDRKTNMKSENSMLSEKNIKDVETSMENTIKEQKFESDSSNKCGTGMKAENESIKTEKKKIIRRNFIPNLDIPKESPAKDVAKESSKKATLKKETIKNAKLAGKFSPIKLKSVTKSEISTPKTPTILNQIPTISKSLMNYKIPLKNSAKRLMQSNPGASNPSTLKSNNINSTNSMQNETSNTPFPEMKHANKTVTTNKTNQQTNITIKNTTHKNNSVDKVSPKSSTVFAPKSNQVLKKSEKNTNFISNLKNSQRPSLLSSLGPNPKAPHGNSGSNVKTPLGNFGSNPKSSQGNPGSIPKTLHGNPGSTPKKTLSNTSSNFKSLHSNPSSNPKNLHNNSSNIKPSNPGSISKFHHNSNPKTPHSPNKSLCSNPDSTVESIRRSKRPAKKKSFGDDFLDDKHDILDEEESEDDDVIQLDSTNDSDAEAAPSSRSVSPFDEENAEDSFDEDFADDIEDDPERLWCICQRPHSGRFMICCDRCEDWFHGSCVGVTKALGKKWEEQEREWICPNCRKAERAIKGIVSPVEKKEISFAKERKKKIKSSSLDDKDRSEARVLVYERTTGKVLSGAAAPTLDILPEWLADHSNYAPLLPSMMALIETDSKTGSKKINLSALIPESPDREGVKSKNFYGSSPKKKKSSKMNREELSSPFYGKDKIKKARTAILLHDEEDFITPHKKKLKNISSSHQRSSSTKTPSSPTKEKSELHRKSSFDKEIERKIKKDKSNPALKSPDVLRTPKPAVPNIRNTVKKLLFEALNKRRSEVPQEFTDLNEDKIKNLCDVIEEQLYLTFNKDLGFKYKSRYRSLVFNIRDHKNGGLFRQILNGTITPSKLANMTSEELASKELAQWREQEEKKELEAIQKHELERLALGNQYIMKSHKGEIMIDKDDFIKEAPSDSMAKLPDTSTTNVTEEDNEDLVNHKNHIYDPDCRICMETELKSYQERESLSNSKESSEKKSSHSKHKKKKVKRSESRDRHRRHSKDHRSKDDSKESSSEKQRSSRHHSGSSHKHRKHSDSDHRKHSESDHRKHSESDDNHKQRRRSESDHKRRDSKKESESDRDRKRSKSHRRESDSDKHRRHSKDHRKRHHRESDDSSDRKRRHSESRDRKGSTDVKRKKSEDDTISVDNKSSNDSNDNSSSQYEYYSNDSKPTDANNDDAFLPNSRLGSTDNAEECPENVSEGWQRERDTYSPPEEGSPAVECPSTPPLPDEYDPTHTHSPPYTPPIPAQEGEVYLSSPATPPLPEDDLDEEDRLTPPPSQIKTKAPLPPAPPSSASPVHMPVWKGIINMPDVAKFSAGAFEVSGKAHHFSSDVPITLEIVGRINPDTVWSYIDQTKKTGSKEILVIRFQPSNEKEKVSYIALYSYLSSKKRYGVIGKCQAVKDFYILPLASHQPIPQVLLPLDGPGFEESRPHMLIGVIVRTRHKRFYDPITGEWINNSSSRQHSVDESYTHSTAPLSDDDDIRSFTPPPSTKLSRRKSSTESSEEDGTPRSSSPPSRKAKPSDRDSMLAELNRQIERDRLELSEMQKTMDQKLEENETSDKSDGITLDVSKISIPSNLQEILDNFKKKEKEIEEKEMEIKRRLKLKEMAEEDLEYDVMPEETTNQEAEDPPAQAQDVDLRLFLPGQGDSVGSGKDQDMRLFNSNPALLGQGPQSGGTSSFQDTDFRRDPRVGIAMQEEDNGGQHGELSRMSDADLLAKALEMEVPPGPHGPIPGPQIQDDPRMMHPANVPYRQPPPHQDIMQKGPRHLMPHPGDVPPGMPPPLGPPFHGEPPRTRDLGPPPAPHPPPFIEPYQERPPPDFYRGEPAPEEQGGPWRGPPRNDWQNPRGPPPHQWPGRDDNNWGPPPHGPPGPGGRGPPPGGPWYPDGAPPYQDMRRGGHDHWNKGGRKRRWREEDSGGGRRPWRRDRKIRRN